MSATDTAIYRSLTLAVFTLFFAAFHADAKEVPLGKITLVLRCDEAGKPIKPKTLSSDYSYSGDPTIRKKDLTLGLPPAMLGPLAEAIEFDKFGDSVGRGLASIAIVARSRPVNVRIEISSFPGLRALDRTTGLICRISHFAISIPGHPLDGSDELRDHLNGADMSLSDVHDIIKLAGLSLSGLTPTGKPK